MHPTQSTKKTPNGKTVRGTINSVFTLSHSTGTVAVATATAMISLRFRIRPHNLPPLLYRDMGLNPKIEVGDHGCLKDPVDDIARARRLSDFT